MARTKRGAEPPKTDLQRMREWLATYPGYDVLGTFRCDYTDQVPGNGGMYPRGWWRSAEAKTS